MPSPFPGMDPYLEGGLWTTLHHSLATEIVRALGPRLRPRYVAIPVEHFVMDIVAGVSVTAATVYPDVSVIETPSSVSRENGGITATVPLRLATVVPEAVPHVSLEIRDVQQCQLVTAIEILSPANKRGEGRREYLTKRQRPLLSAAHLIEMDLLRQGARVPMQQPLPKWPYFILLSRAAERPFMDVWPITLQSALPTVPVPLLPGDADVPLDVQAAFTAAYDLLGYDLIVDYTQPPDVPLSEEDYRWVDRHLRAAGRRA